MSITSVSYTHLDVYKRQLYTSVIPNLLVEDLRDAIMESKAKKVYVCNVMTQAGETDNFSAYDHLKAIITHCGKNFIDYILVNTTEIPAEVKLKYKYKDSSSPVYINDEEIKKIEDMGTKVIPGDFVDIKHNYVRHNAEEVSRKIIEKVK